MRIKLLAELLIAIVIFVEAIKFAGTDACDVDVSYYVRCRLNRFVVGILGVIWVRH